MKKILFLFLFSVIFLSSLSLVNAQGDEIREGDSSTPSAKVEKIEYTLPYPGLLSDSPLYFLKALRDRITELLMADPVKKAEFYLLSADKRLNEGALLFDKGSFKYSLAESTISKGENYFEKGIGQLQLAKKQNLPVDSLIQKYRLAALKHEEVIEGLMSRSSGDIKGRLMGSQKRVEEFQKLLSQFKLPG